MLFSFTISKSNFITYIILFYNSTHIKKLYSFTFSIKYYFLIFLYYIFSIITFFQIPTVTFSQALDLCFFFPDSHSPTLLNFVFFFFPVLHSPTVTFFMGYATPFFSNGDVDSNIEIRRIKREKGNDVPDRANRNFRSKQKVE